MTPPISAGDIARMLAQRIDALVRDLLPAGHREGPEWRVGSVAGECGSSLGVHLVGTKAGVWADFATGRGGDALDLVRNVLDLGMPGALTWSRRWLRIDDGEAALPQRAAAPPASEADHRDPLRWQRPWNAARPITGTLAATYLASRGLHFDDPDARVLRYLARRVRKAPDNAVVENHPALLAALCDARTGEQCGIINIYLQRDGRDRLRDPKGKTCTGRAKGAVVMLSAFDEPTYGMTMCEGIETGIALLMADLAPVWAAGGAGFLAALPVLSGIETLTVAADADSPGRRAAEVVAGRWCEAGREVAIVAPPAGDWAAPGEEGVGG
jgi:hypothetical protein